MNDPQTDTGRTYTPQTPGPAPPSAVPLPPTTRDPRDPRMKSPLLAGILSLMPGLGHVYLGYYQRGFVHALIVAGVITMLGTIEEFTPVVPFAFMFLVFFWLYNVIDGSRRAVYVNQIVAGGEPIDVPEDFKVSGMRGSILGGAVLIGVGVIALTNTVFGISLEWVGTWWPLAPIGFGAYLVWKAIQEQGS